MKYLLTICVLIILLPLSANSKDFDFKKKSIRLDKIDTTDCIEFITRNAKIIVEKSDYITRLEKNHESYANYIDTINSLTRPCICLIQNPEEVKTICKNCLNLQFFHDNALIINYDLAKILLTGKAQIIVNGQDQIIHKIKVREKTYKETMGSTYIEFIDPKSKKEILSMIIGLGE